MRPPTTDCVRRTFNTLTDAQLVGQLLMVGVPAENPDSALGVLAHRPVGGIFLADHTSASPSTVAARIAPLSAAITASSGVAPHVSVDQEGGQVQTLRPPGLAEIPSGLEQGRLDEPDLAALTSAWAAELRDAGVTLDLAPVADTVEDGTAQDNPPVGAFDRQYGSDPKMVATQLKTVVKAMQDNRIGATVKHFPGLGRVTSNTDTSDTAEDSRATRTDPNLQPFQAAIDADTIAVMISSARYPRLDPDNIAAFSSAIITGLLRTQMHFQGLVISDDLGNAVAVNSITPADRAVRFVAAGGDLVLTVQIDDLSEMTDALRKRFDADSDFRTTVVRAVTRVLESKDKLKMLPCSGS